MSDPRSIQQLYLGMLQEAFPSASVESNGPFHLNLEPFDEAFLDRISGKTEGKLAVTPSTKATRRNQDMGPRNLHNVPSEIRVAVYNLLFKNALMTFTPRARSNRKSPVVQGQSDVFKKENMATNILLVCKNFYREGIKELFNNLTIEEGRCGSINFHNILSDQTQAELASIRNFNAELAVNIFPKLALWVGTQKLRICHKLEPQLTTLTSEALYNKVVKTLSSAERPTDALIAWVNNKGRKYPVFFGEYEIAKCDSLDKFEGKTIQLLVAESMNPCHHIDVSLGHLYVDYRSERAIFDGEDKLGRDMCWKTLREM